MAKYYYKKSRRLNGVKILSLIIVLLGAGLFLYVFFPILSWQIYFAPVFASQNLEIPIPKTAFVSNQNIGNLIYNAGRSLTTDYTQAGNWYPNFNPAGAKNGKNYTLSIPKIGISNANVTNMNGDLSKQLVQYNSDSLPPFKGNNVIYGHSTLPQLFDPKNYKTIFANLYKVVVGDVIEITVDGVTYNYKIQTITVVEPEDTSVLAQNFGDSFITLITCTPPGTVWKRLIVRAKIEKL